MRSLLALVLGAALIAGAGAFGYGLGRRSAEIAAPPVAAPLAPRGALAPDEDATIALFEAAQGSVAFIATEARRVDPWRRRATEVPRGTGSGFVWDGRGHVVTNAHVVAGAGAATVRLPEGRAFEARLVGVDEAHDLAVLRIDAPRAALAPLPVGTSGDLRVGQAVFAIGNPFGLDFTLTTGIVSALDRELPGEAGVAITGLIQTDAAINPGNSGGPLLDSAGRLVGVNTAIYSPSGASAGIGFAVPVDAVNRVVPQLIARGRYDPPVIGITADPRADALLAREGAAGVLVLDVAAGSPAAEAGIEGARMRRDGALVPGDVIVALDGAPLAGIDAMRAALDDRRAGQEVTLTLRREGAERAVTLELAAGS